MGHCGTHGIPQVARKRKGHFCCGALAHLGLEATLGFSPRKYRYFSTRCKRFGGFSRICTHCPSLQELIGSLSSLIYAVAREKQLSRKISTVRIRLGPVW